MCGCADWWMCGCADWWMCGLVDVRIGGCADVWMCGCVDVRMCGLKQKGHEINKKEITEIYTEIKNYEESNK